VAGATVAVGAMSVAAAMALAAALIGGAGVTSQKLAGAADAAALAAADVASGAVIAEGDACQVAARVAAASGAHLDECFTRGLVATVQVSAAYSGINAVARSRAGPPEVAAVDE